MLLTKGRPLLPMPLRVIKCHYRQNHYCCYYYANLFYYDFFCPIIRHTLLLLGTTLCIIRQNFLLLGTFYYYQAHFIIIRHNLLLLGTTYFIIWQNFLLFGTFYYYQAHFIIIRHNTFHYSAELFIIRHISVLHSSTKSLYFFIIRHLLSYYALCIHHQGHFYLQAQFLLSGTTHLLETISLFGTLVLIIIN